MTGEIEHSAKRRLLRGAAIVGFWLLVGLANAAQSHMAARIEGVPAPVLLSIARAVPVWLFWIPVTPVIAWLGRRWRLGREKWPRSVAAHMMASVFATALHSLWLLGLYDLLGVTAGMTETRGEFLRILFLSRLYLDVLTYGAVLGAAYAFDYHDRYRERELRASRLEAQLARARVDALRMQLNPHFLFNALHSVAAQVRAGRGNAAVAMLGGLGELLRYALESDDAVVVPLWQELAFLDRYLDIERVRFADRLSVVVDVPEDALQGRVPPLLLQPLVENAVRHGIAPRDAQGRIEVRARREGDRLAVSVRDDGLGFVEPHSNGVGLANTRARLAELYGEGQSFEIRTPPEGGVEVQLSLPWDPEGGVNR